MNTRNRLLVAALILVALRPVAGFATPEAGGAIRADAIRGHITYLASDELGGRGSGTKGNEEAARYIATAFRRAGLKPVGTAKQNDLNAAMDGTGYFQPFSFVAGVAKGRDNVLEATIGGNPVRYRAGSEFEPSGISGSGRAEGEVVFVGYGIQSRDPARDDYANVEVRDKVVLLFAGAPTADPHSPLMGQSDLRRKALTARERGAKAVIVVLPKDSDHPRTDTAETNDAGVPILLVKRSVATAWLNAAGQNLESTEEALAREPRAFPTGVTVRLAADVRKVTKRSANILGFLEGSDPALKEEVVVIGAHMDHLGNGGAYSLDPSRKPAIHHGADDNASGTAGVLALADYFSSTSTRPKRSLLFICFSGEELGLLGSAHYVKNPVIPIEKTAAMVNMDMIGRMQNNKLIVVGSGTSPAWSSLLDQVNGAARFDLARSESGFGASDQQSFYASKVPVLFFFTGLHADYHRPSDTADKINAEDEARVVNFVAECATRIANAPERPAYQQMAVPQEQAPARFRVSLGSIPDYAAQVEGVQLSGVRPGSPAEKAGLKAGDIIVKFGGKTIRNVQEYTIALTEHKPGDEVEIVVKRGNETVTLKAILAASSR
jgi:aminopeptidase YwaD